MMPTHGRPSIRANCSAGASKISCVGATRATSIATWRSAASSIVNICSLSDGALFAVSLNAHGLPLSGSLSNRATRDKTSTATGNIDCRGSCIARRRLLRDRKGVNLRTLIVDDSEAFLESARLLLESQGLEIVATSTTRAEALDRAAALSPDLALVDVELGQEDGVALADELRSRSPGTRVVLISTYSSDEMQDLISASSAVGFLPK